MLWWWLRRYVEVGCGRRWQGHAVYTPPPTPPTSRTASTAAPPRPGRGRGGGKKMSRFPSHPPPLGCAHGGRCEHHPCKPSSWAASHAPDTTPPPPSLQRAVAQQAPHQQAAASREVPCAFRCTVQQPLGERGWPAPAGAQRPPALAAPAGGVHDAAGQGPHRPVFPGDTVWSTHRDPSMRGSWGAGALARAGLAPREGRLNLKSMDPARDAVPSTAEAGTSTRPGASRTAAKGVEGERWLAKAHEAKVTRNHAISAFLVHVLK